MQDVLRKLSCILFYIVGLLSVVARSTHGKSYVASGTVYTDHGVARFEPGVMDPKGAAYGFFNNTLNETGWGILDFKAGHGLKISDNNEIMFAAGFLEGVLTAREIDLHYMNIYNFFIGSKPNPKKLESSLRKFFTKQDQWMRGMIASQADKDPFWKHVSYLISQFDGVWAGYQSAKGGNTTQDKFMLQVLNAAGDLLDILQVLNPETRPDFSKLGKNELKNYILANSRCSALVKVTGAFENIFMSHATWFSYSSMNRIFKHYDFNINDPQTAAKQISFSSYPGCVESVDTFYMLGSQNVVLQTTNNVFNSSLYDTVSPSSLLAWQRVRVANMLAKGGRQWSSIFARYNSGTYNNQYMVIDLKKIKLKTEIKDDALWVVEQIPTLVEGGDITDILRAGYWPSYNVPFFEKIYNLSGYPAIVTRFGVDMSYQLAPRAKIFRRDSAMVRDLFGMRQIMRYNNYTQDPYSEGDPCNTVCCRGDLKKKMPRPSGCYDAKVTDFAMALNLQAQALSGPTLSNGLPPFSWKGRFQDASHIGLPESYNFPWILMKPRLKAKQKYDLVFHS